jgi:hypothetical protein
MAKTSIEYHFGPNGETRLFRSEDDLLAFIGSRDFLGWVDELQPHSANAANWLSQKKSEIVNMVRSAIQSRGFEQAPYHVSQILGVTPFPTGRMPLAKKILKLSKSDQDRAYYLLCAAMRASDSSIGYDHIRGGVELALFEQKVTPDSVESTNETLTELIRSVEQSRFAADENEQERQNQFSVQSLERDEVFAKNLKKFEADEEVIRQKTRDQVSGALSELSTTSALEVESLHNLQKAYVEHMALDASVSYWEGKATRHRAKLVKHGGLELLVPVYFVVCVGVALCYATYIVLPSLEPSNPQRTVVFSALGLLITSLMLWYGRLLTRNLMTQRHLYEDAEERRVMLKSYIALTKEGHVDKEDRVLALGAAFRPASDGVGKDDGSPDLSTATIIGRLVQNK